MNLTLQQAETLMDELIAIPHDLKENQEAVLFHLFLQCWLHC